MKRRVIALLTMYMSVLTVATQTHTEPPKPGPEVRRLEVFLGKWITQGEAKASPYGPAGRVTAMETFEWLPGAFFMLHRSEGRQGMIEFNWVEVLGYDARKKIYTTHTFDNFGNSVLWEGTWRDNTLTWIADSYIAGKALKERCMITAKSATIIVGKCEYATDGKTWQPNVDITWTRAR
jgi:hypothetical protein